MSDGGRCGGKVIVNYYTWIFWTRNKEDKKINECDVLKTIAPARR